MTGTDTEAHAAIEALAHRIRQRDEAMRDGGDYADAEPFAAEYVAALRGRGWRPTAAKAGPPPVHAPAGTASKPRSELLSDLRAEMDAKAAAARAVKDAPAEAGAT